MRETSKRAAAVNGLRDAYVRLAYIRCMNELEGDQEWTDDFPRIAARKIARMLRVLEPKRRLPNVMHDTAIGQAIKEARKAERCKHACSGISSCELRRRGTYFV